MKQKSLNQLQKEIDNFNSKHSVGSEVKLMLDDGEVKTVTINHKATILGGHTAVGWFDGVSGCYNLNSIVE